MESVKDRVDAYKRIAFCVGGVWTALTKGLAIRLMKIDWRADWADPRNWRD